MNEKILIVEDRKDSADLMKFSLEKLKYNVSITETGELALAFVNKEKPDLILLDLMLPGMTGLEVLEKIRQDKANDKIKIIVLTAAKLDKEKQDAFIKMGAQVFLPKPVPIDELRKEVEKILKK